MLLNKEAVRTLFAFNPEMFMYLRIVLMFGHYQITAVDVSL